MNLTKLALKRPVSCFLVILALAVFGISSIFGFKMELTPDIEMPMLIVMATYPGADPESVDELVASVIEDSGSTLSGVDSVNSYSFENYCMVLFTYEYGVDIDECHNDLRAAMETAKLSLPDDVDQPTIIEMNMNSMDVMTISAVEKGDVDLLKVVNEAVVPELESLSSVAQVSVTGGSEDYIKVELNETLMKQYGLIFGTSICYTSKNYKVVTSDEFLDMIIGKGCRFTWYFHYMPVGNDAAPELLPTPAQRRETYERIRKYRATKPLFAMDFQNDAEFVGGCIAGGRRYLHINANGDIDPCVFIHYSDSNIREKTLLEALQSPMMMAYHDGQPFNDNMYRPCPMLENPQKLREMVEKSGAHSTDLQSPESAEHLCAKCDRYAENWKPVAEEMWKEDQERKAAKKGC